MSDINHPNHYTQEDAPCECIDVAREYPFDIGNSVKYAWRHMDKGNPVRDMCKALRYIDDAFANYTSHALSPMHPSSTWTLLRALEEADWNGLRDYWLALRLCDLPAMRDAIARRLDQLDTDWRDQYYGDDA